MAMDTAHGDIVMAGTMDGIPTAASMTHTGILHIMDLVMAITEVIIVHITIVIILTIIMAITVIITIEMLPIMLAVGVLT